MPFKRLILLSCTLYLDIIPSNLPLQVLLQPVIFTYPLSDPAVYLVSLAELT